MSSHLTTHILDSSTGAPAPDVAVRLSTASGSEIAAASTNDDGRAALGPERLDAGDYTLTFATGPYFAARGVDAFYPHVTVTFTVEVGDDGTSRHYHVPLLLSPFAYSTYRGS
ncbi:hydroxyisourate hydrolase [Microbacterium sp. LRZ72]|uniref:hydroxyisourate hydrolase n=1 Tax=Microbacterium sp. LRZ72 TaxID=2942481 RepID=UPI0029B5372E|nr:hydroxyisourate hydrolase [Microbacterium sp. LRZ72]MDX2376299.1 hydroxyisourate hydrolase [Microbacterium sp. LRZ72]